PRRFAVGQLVQGVQLAGQFVRSNNVYRILVGEGAVAKIVVAFRPAPADHVYVEVSYKLRHWHNRFVVRIELGTKEPKLFTGVKHNQDRSFWARPDRKSLGDLEHRNCA